MKKVLSIAGSDPSGGAGIQADLKTMCAMGVYGMTVVTAVTVQNTQAVYDVQEMSAEIVAGQMKAIYSDIPVDGVKIGMVSSSTIIHTIRDKLLEYGAKNIVVDPVMVSKSGFHLLRPDAVAAVERLIAIADIVTPNLPEAALICGFPVESEAEMRAAAEHITGMGAKNVLIKGGHRPGDDSGDLLLTPDGFTILPAKRVPTQNTHGTGCTLSSAIASQLALGKTVTEAVRISKEYITQAITDSFPVGQGVGPVGHLSALYRKAGMEID